MPKIFDDNFDISTDGEFFWHATTVKNVFSMIKFDAGGLKPVGTGLLRIPLELAIKSESCLANSAIVGVKIFSPTVEPINLQFKYSGKSYDLKPAVLEENTLKTDDDPMNFHDESWLDLDEMVKILKA
jgi:hypothetical protein